MLREREHDIVRVCRAAPIGIFQIEIEGSLVESNDISAGLAAAVQFGWNQGG